MKHTISVLVENKFGVLARIAGMFSGRGFNIDTLNVGPMHDGKYSRITATLNGDESALDQAIKQLGKLINVLEVNDYASDSTHALRKRRDGEHGREPKSVQADVV